MATKLGLCSKCRVEWLGSGNWCETCRRDYYLANRARILADRKAHRQERTQYLRNWRVANPDRVASYKERFDSPRYSKTYRSKLRNEMFEAYGKSCVCCGVSDLDVLSLDHIEGGGTKHFKRLGTYGVLRELRDAGWPTGFRILCFNCNLATAHGKACPHQGGSKEPTYHPCVSKRFRETRSKLIAILGNRCEDCGETTTVFLTLEHINGGGKKEQKRYKSTHYMREAIIANPECWKNYRCLCMNCNWKMRKQAKG